jgi:hypothetical protein
MKQTTYLLSLPYSGTLPPLLFFILGLLHLWKKTPPIALGELNPNIFAGLLETLVVPLMNHNVYEVGSVLSLDIEI